MLSIRGFFWIKGETVIEHYLNYYPNLIIYYPIVGSITVIPQKLRQGRKIKWKRFKKDFNLFILKFTLFLIKIILGKTISSLFFAFNITVSHFKFNPGIILMNGLIYIYSCLLLLRISMDRKGSLNMIDNRDIPSLYTESYFQVFNCLHKSIHEGEYLLCQTWNNLSETLNYLLPSTPYVPECEQDHDLTPINLNRDISSPMVYYKDILPSTKALKTPDLSIESRMILRCIMVHYEQLINNEELYKFYGSTNDKKGISKLPIPVHIDHLIKSNRVRLFQINDESGLIIGTIKFDDFKYMDGIKFHSDLGLLSVQLAWILTRFRIWSEDKAQYIQMERLIDLLGIKTCKELIDQHLSYLRLYESTRERDDKLGNLDFNCLGLGNPFNDSKYLLSNLEYHRSKFLDRKDDYRPTLYELMPIVRSQGSEFCSKGPSKALKDLENQLCSNDMPQKGWDRRGINSYKFIRTIVPSIHNDFTQRYFDDESIVLFEIKFSTNSKFFLIQNNLKDNMKDTIVGYIVKDPLDFIFKPTKIPNILRNHEDMMNSMIVEEDFEYLANTDSLQLE